MTGLSRKDKYLWVFDEVQLLNQTQSDLPFEDFSAFYFEDPDVVREIEARIDRILPPVFAFLGSKGYRHVGVIRKEAMRKVRASRRVGIVPEHPRRPLIPGRYPDGYSRVDIEFSSRSAMLENYLSLTFLERTDIHLILRLVGDTSHNGIPTELTCDEDLEDRQPRYSVRFQSGYGLCSDTDDELTEDILDRLALHIEFLELAQDVTMGDHLRTRYDDVVALVNRIGQRH
jgi:hypothetical protein